MLEEGAEVHAAVLALVLSLEPAKRKALQRLLLTVDNGAPMAVCVLCLMLLSFPRLSCHLTCRQGWAKGWSPLPAHVVHAIPSEVV